MRSANTGNAGTGSRPAIGDTRAMTRNMSRLWVWWFAVMLSVSAAWAQQNPGAADIAAFTQPELDQMLAPIALYPDPLLSQILMAATYPLEVVEAARWSKGHPELTGEQAVASAEPYNWDPSVKSLLAFPQIMSVMDERIDWTERLGNAFIAQQPQVMSSIQGLRQRAYGTGSLIEMDPLRVESQDQAILIEPGSPESVSVPYFDPLVVYGAWWWPAYPPVSWAPWHGYSVRPGYRGRFAWGPPVIISRTFFFGAWDWHQRRAIVIRTPPYNALGRNRAPSVTMMNAGVAAWQHNPEHRRGVPYRNPASDRQAGRKHAAPVAQQEVRKPDATPSPAVSHPENGTTWRRQPPESQHPQR
jgi:uncharacterized protein DUF3300